MTQNYIKGKKRLAEYNGEYPWITRKKLHGFWNKDENKFAYLVWLFAKLKIKKIDDCYLKLNLKNLRKYGFGTHSQLVSPVYISKVIFGKKNLKPWLFKRSPQGLFKDKKIIKEYFLWLFKKLKVKNNEDIYKKINTVVLGENSGRALCDTPDNYYKTTNFRQIIIKTFPQKKLIEWQFFNIRRGFWEKKSNLILLKNYIAKKHKFKKLNDWYKLNNKILIKDGSFYITRKYPNAISFLRKIYPKKKWLQWNFSKVTGIAWNSKKFQKTYIEYFVKQKKIEKPTDWYKIERKDFIETRGGYGLLKKIKSVLKIASFHYPKFKFYAWKFKKIERGFFKDKKNVLNYIHWLEDKFRIKTKKDWYNYGYENISNNNGHSLLQIFSHSPLKILQYCYPKYPWDVLRFGKTSKFEKQLYKLVKRLLKNKKIIHRYRSKLFRFKKSKRPMEIDIYLPEFKTGIEFQGSQHYFAKWGKHELVDIKRRDREKKKTFKKNGIKILYVTYKWKGQKKPIIKLLKKNKILF